MSVAIFAVTNRGIENISAAEMQTLPGLHIETVSYRRVSANYDGDLTALLGLRTVDDIFLDLGEWHGISHIRAALEDFRMNSVQLPLRPALNIIAELRPVDSPPFFSVTANFVGKRNYSVQEIKTAVAEGISAGFRWRYTEENQSDLNIRLFIEHETVSIGMRIGETALHRRPYKIENIPGSLKPSVAAAMLRMAEVKIGDTLLDPCCGAGTILIEGRLHGVKVVGGDLSPDALQAAHMNTRQAKVSLPLALWDVSALPLPSASMDAIVSNIPWGQQISIENDSALFYHALCAELERVCKPSGSITLLTNQPQHIQFQQFSLQSAQEISLFGETPSILRFTRP